MEDEYCKRRSNRRGIDYKGVGRHYSEWARVVGGGVLGVDLMEDDTRGLLVHEINNTVEFRGASKVAKTDIANAIIDYSIEAARK